MNAAGTPRDTALLGLTGYEGVNPGNSLLASAPWDTMVATHVAAAQRFYAGGAGAASSSTTNNHDVDFNGGIHITGNFADGGAIGGAVATEIKRHLVANSNTGLQ
jgi:hypothetical protein